MTSLHAFAPLRAMGWFLARTLAGCALAACTAVMAQETPVQVVYHLNEGGAQASRALEFIRNHMEADPKVRILVVAHAAGVDFLMRGAKTEKGNEYRTQIEDLELQGVKFRVCEITLRERNLTRDRFLPEAGFVSSGVAEVARLQRREGYAYIRP